MKKPFALLAILVLFAFTGCGNRETGVHIGDADNVVVFYSTRSYAMATSDEDTVAALKDYLNNLSFESTEKEIDYGTMINVNFLQGEQQVAQIGVDQNGVFWLNGKTDCWTVASGTFDYNYIKTIYEKGRSEE